jgi:predicted RNA-binding Zn-ribbon protein involved in translation (DUF1610 family)
VPISMKCPSCGKILSAPDTAAGKRAKCPACAAVMIVPEVVREAEEIRPEEGPQLFGLMDEINPPAPQPPPGAQPADQGGGPRRPCPMCGEMILTTAAKCRFCGTIFDYTLKREEEKKRGRASDADLTTADWIFCILCAGIACIVGIVYAIQGKPKGMKMVGISLVASIVWGVINAILQNALNTGPHGFR